MKALVLAPLVLLAACQAPTIPELSYGSKLDRVGARPNPPVAMGDEEAAAITAQVVAFRVEAQALRLELAREPNRVTRIDDLKRLQAIGDQSRPLEQKLRNARRPVPDVPQAG